MSEWEKFAVIFCEGCLVVLAAWACYEVVGKIKRALKSK